MVRKARILLKKKKAIVYHQVPFTIQLTYQPETNILQPISLGIDDGAKQAGIAAVCHFKKRKVVVVKSTLSLRCDTKKHIDNRRARRRLRRSRLRNRQPRRRRKDKTGWIPPSVKVRKDNIIRLVKSLSGLLPVTDIIWEEGQFDTHKLVNPKVKGTGYNKGFDFCFENRKAAVFFRDFYVCQYCGINCIEAGMVATVDHVIPKSRGGTDTFKNLVCACYPCNQKKGDLTAAEFGFPHIVGKTFAYPAHLQCGKKYLEKGLKKIAKAESVFGYETKLWRVSLGLKKSHINDAIAMVVKVGQFFCEAEKYNILPRRRRRDMHNRKHSSFCGFVHFDLVKWHKRNGEKVIGTVRSFVPSRNIVKCRFLHNDNVGVSVKRLSLKQRFKGFVYQPG
ncbi:MAG: RNA-guided endonuclease IscB [Candidatus Poribacteria bacterium]